MLSDCQQPGEAFSLVDKLNPLTKALRHLHGTLLAWDVYNVTASPILKTNQDQSLPVLLSDSAYAHVHVVCPSSKLTVISLLCLVGLSLLSVCKAVLDMLYMFHC